MRPRARCCSERCRPPRQYSRKARETGRTGRNRLAYPPSGFEANSPITAVDATLFEHTSTVDVETVLNQLPQFVPAVTQFSTTNVQNEATSTVGASTISLRGLGSNRNLVLIMPDAVARPRRS